MAPLDWAICHAFEYLQATKNWRWTTVDCNMGGLLGAWKRLPHYTLDTHQLKKLDLNSSPWFRDAMRYVGRMAREQAVLFPKAVKPSQMQLLLIHLRETDRLMLHALGTLVWYTCARVGDAAQLKKEEVTLKPTACCCEAL